MSELTEARRVRPLAYCRINMLQPEEEALFAPLYHSAASYM